MIYLQLPTSSLFLLYRLNRKRLKTRKKLLYISNANVLWKSSKQLFNTINKVLLFSGSVSTLTGSDIITEHEYCQVICFYPER